MRKILLIDHFSKLWFWARWSIQYVIENGALRASKYNVDHLVSAMTPWSNCEEKYTKSAAYTKRR